MRNYTVLGAAIVLFVLPVTFYSSTHEVSPWHIALGILILALAMYATIILGMVRSRRVRSKGAKRKRKHLLPFLYK